MRTLQQGFKGDDIRLWQEFLIAQGLLAAGLNTSEFGPKTAAATRQFQTQHGLEADGLVGPNTLAKAQALGFDPSKATAATGATADGASPFDAHSEALLQQVHPELARRVRDLGRLVADQMQSAVDSGFRSFEEQAKLFAIGRTKPPPPKAKVTNAKPGDSYHNYGLAVDMVSLVGGAHNWNEADARGKLAPQVQLEWGGTWTDFPDLPHFQLTGGLTIGRCRALHDQGGIQAVWAEVDKQVAGRGLEEMEGEHVE
jgi:peptidoglycan hydrolase-like protein with peptidoglycan-binding domain